MANPINELPVRILAVIVLYKMHPSESVSFRTLKAAASSSESGQADIRILLYDNTPGGQDTGVLPEGVQYKADFENGGLAKAYNYALEIAKEDGFDWLLTLDQDTSLPLDFVDKLCRAATFVSSLDNVAAIVPCLSGGGRAISPWIPRKRWMRPQRFPDGFVGIPLENVYAANSASAIKVSALKVIDGYDPRFYLWASDLAMYHRLHRNDFRVFIAGNIHVEHECSISDLKHQSSPGKYADMLGAEEAFYDEYMGWPGHIELLLILFHRLAYRLWTTGGDLAYFRIVISFICRRLLYSRKHRIKSSKQAGLRERNIG